MRKYISFVKIFISLNPLRVLFFILLLPCIIFTLSSNIFEDYKYEIHTIFEYGGEDRYVIKSDTSTQFRYVKLSEDDRIENGYIIIKEVSELFILYAMMTGIFTIIYIISCFNDNWDITTLYRKYYIKQISIHKDTDFIYYVLNKKVIKKIPNDQDGLYFHSSSTDIGYCIDDYRDNKTILDDFNGTRMEIRENSLNEILS